MPEVAAHLISAFLSQRFMNDRYHVVCGIYARRFDEFDYGVNLTTSLRVFICYSLRMNFDKAISSQYVAARQVVLS